MEEDQTLNKFDSNETEIKSECQSFSLESQVNADEVENPAVSSTTNVQIDQNKEFKKIIKRGRPKYEHLKPTRESKRKRKCSMVINYEPTEKTRSIWSKKDKTELLKALESFGPDNIDEIKRCVHTKSESDIRNQIKMWKEFASRDLQKKLLTEKKKLDSATVNCITKLDEWIKNFEELSEMSSMSLFALSNVFLFIAEYGKFPPPEECNGVDFRSIYHYIHCMLNGIPYFGVNQETAQVLYESIIDVFRVMRRQNLVNKLQPHVYIPQSPRSVCRTYSRPSIRGKFILKKLMNNEAIMNLPNINPLNVPLSILKKTDLSNSYKNDDGDDGDDDDDDDDVDDDDDNNDDDDDNVDF